MPCQERPELHVSMMRAKNWRAFWFDLDGYPDSYLEWIYPPIEAVEHYKNIGYMVIGLDPEDEVRWRLWRAAHPEAA